VRWLAGQWTTLQQRGRRQQHVDELGCHLVALLLAWTVVITSGESEVPTTQIF
jgi:hypothetical protein